MQKLESEQPTFDGVANDLLVMLAMDTHELPDSRGRYPYVVRSEIFKNTYIKQISNMHRANPNARELHCTMLFWGN